MLTLYSQEEATEMSLKRERAEGRAEGEIKGVVEMCQEFGKNIADTILTIARKFDLSESASHKPVNQYRKS